MCRGYRPGNNQLLQVIKQRQMTFRKVGHICRPVQHLQVDVGVVIAGPGRIRAVVPLSLKMHWQGSFAGCRYHQIACILKHQNHKLRVIVPPGLGFKPPPGRNRIVRRSLNIKGNSAEKMLIIFLLNSLKLCIVCHFQGFHPGKGLGLPFRIAVLRILVLVCCMCCMFQYQKCGICNFGHSIMIRNNAIGFCCKQTQKFQPVVVNMPVMYQSLITKHQTVNRMRETKPDPVFTASRPVVFKAVYHRSCRITAKDGSPVRG